jgi:methanogenic corrinoid protein MtbC1
MSNKSSNRSSGEHAQKIFPAIQGDDDEPMCSTDEQIDEFGKSMLSRLRKVIEGDLVPRLMLAVDTPRRESSDSQVVERLQESVEEFVQLLIAHDASVASRYVGMLRADGMPLSTLYLDLLAPAARHLGEMWERDECSFTDVTIGVCRMHQVILEFSRCFDASPSSERTSKNALILPVPGEQHSFGIFMVMEFMRKDGWNCFSGNPASMSEFHKLLRSQDFDVIGISVSAERHVDSARALIREIRSATRNSGSLILAGGRIFIENPELAKEIGADGMASDGRKAVSELRRLHVKNKHLSSD